MSLNEGINGMDYVFVITSVKQRTKQRWTAATLGHIQ